MDQVWILSLCLTLLGFFIFILSLKAKKEPEPESIIKKSVPSQSYYARFGGKNLDLDEDEVEKMMEKLNKLLYEEPKKKEVPQERRKLVIPEKAEVSPLNVKDAESPSETQETVGKGPAHTQPAYQPSHRVQERHAPPAMENIMDEIEQAVQETAEEDYYTRRRQERAAARARHVAETEQ